MSRGIPSRRCEADAVAPTNTTSYRLNRGSSNYNICTVCIHKLDINQI